MTPQEAVQHLLRGGVFSFSQAQDVMRGIMQGQATAVQIGALLVLLRQRGEQVQEIAGFASVMREMAVAVQAPPGVVLDTCGTGGDATGTFNISTLAALVVAAAGIPVAKHGNRSVSSRVGSADLLEGLGVRLELTPDQVGACLQETGFGFLFAPMHHQAMKHAIVPRRELGVRTVFNVLGPLTNPAGVSHQIVGVYDPHLLRTLAEVLSLLGVQRALVVHGDGGVDEISCTGPTQVAELHGGVVRERQIALEEFGVAGCRLEDLRGGDLEENVRIAQAVLDGEEGPMRDAVAVNAGAALYIAGQAEDLRSGTQLASELLSRGAARDRLRHLVQWTRQAETT